MVEKSNRQISVNFVGPKNEVCPQIQCPGYIPQSCRIAQYDIGSDGITKCPMCDKDGCLAYGASFKVSVHESESLRPNFITIKRLCDSLLFSMAVKMTIFN